MNPIILVWNGLEYVYASNSQRCCLQEISNLCFFTPGANQMQSSIGVLVHKPEALITNFLFKDQR